MSIIELLALFVVALTVIKLLVILVNPKIWYKSVVKVVLGSGLTAPIALILAAGSFYYIIQEISIIQIFAVMFFFMFITLLSFVPYKKEMMPVIDRLYKSENLLQRSWLPLLIWIGLLAWAISALLK